MKILLIVILILLAIDLFIVHKCLQLIMKPYRYTKEGMRQKEIDNGFEDCVIAYEQEWERRPFTLECDKAVLSGEFIDNPDAKEDKVAIVAHGHTANRYASLKYAKIFYDEGYNVVLYDERHFGESSGDVSTLGMKEREDLLKVIGLVKERYGQDCHIALHGESMGAATVLLVLRDIDVDLVVADCPFSDSVRLFREYIVNNLHIPPVTVMTLLIPVAKYIHGYLIEDTAPIKAVESSDVPICFMHGTADKLIDCDHSKQMIKVAKNPLSRLHLFEGSDHAMSIVNNRSRYEKLMKEFINEVNKEAV